MPCLSEEPPPGPVAQLQVGGAVPLDHTDSTLLLCAAIERPEVAIYYCQFHDINK